jgi:NitT/TauT family transport system permease protein
MTTRFAKAWLLTNLPVALVFIAWALVAQVLPVNAIIFPSPGSVLQDVIDHPYVYLHEGGVTFKASVYGLLLGVLMGTGMALLSWCSFVLKSMLLPVSLLLATIPVVAIIPIITRIFGPGMSSVLCVVTVVTFLPTFVAVSSGLHAVEHSHESLFKVFGARKWQQLRYLAIPAAVPHFMMALGISAPSSVIGAMTAEYLIGSEGLGYQLRSAMANFATDRVVGGALLSTVMSIFFLSLAQSACTRILARWG